MARREARTTEDDVHFVVIHGHRRAYRLKGSGPALLLIHGLACDSRTWLPVIDQLAEHFTVIAPDLLGHGESAAPRADYSLGAYANGMRDLLTVLGIDKVTVVGHSLGGGVAMQFGYQFPERTERIVLVSTGGLGPQVTPLIRLLTVPGSEYAVRLATARPWRPVVAGTFRTLSRLPLLAAKDLDEFAEVYEALADLPKLRAIRSVTSHVVDWRGQVVTMADRGYLARLMPVMVVWGQDDLVIPVSHAGATPRLGTSEVHVFPRVGHFPHKADPQRFVDLLVNFCESHPAVPYHRGKWRSLLRRGDQYVVTPDEPLLAVSSSGAAVS